ncbi:sentrin/sumo-specific protease, senp8, putative [Ricinus communis]|uniref:Sentrin/sumo-specific protease, senp8, putative n=1 Tax=Ricinus communis TaxID=3988 RepID=B9S3Q6_RICCO|nr:sentrin/sumo-specific protease, senp8, putative [Ricinus communis]
MKKKGAQGTLSSDDLCLLKGPHYLSDSIIDFYFNYLSSFYSPDDDDNGILFVSPTVSFWLANCGDDPDTIKAFLEPLNLSSKNLIFFTVNDSDRVVHSGGGGGTHWSLLVFCREMNRFVHHDSCHGINYWKAVDLYDVVKEHVKRSSESSDTPAEEVGSRSDSEFPRKIKKKKNRQYEVPEVIFVEGRTPQQTNGHDCGLYVMAIAKAICQWYDSDEKNDEWFSTIDEEVHASLENSMRREVLKLITDEDVFVY